MWNKKTKIFPKIKKKLKWFLTDESWKISKKDALWLATGSILLSWADEISAGHSNHGSHSSWPGWHLNQGHASWNLRSWHVSANPGAVTKTSHASWIVNGHYSSTPNWWVYDPAHASGYGNWWHLNQWAVNWRLHANHGNHSNHGSHASHGSHGSHGSRW